MAQLDPVTPKGACAPGFWASLRTLAKSHEVDPAEQPVVFPRPAPRPPPPDLSPPKWAAPSPRVPWEEGPSSTKAVASSLVLLPSAGCGAHPAHPRRREGVWGVLLRLADTPTPCQGD